ncbi:hypothetical protein AX14_005735 [Amanita brunnescens Koide BX004]|nr:hypothetical protein AX14_005735 [Amanita brunnescens Koide BX004]
MVRRRGNKTPAPAQKGNEKLDIPDDEQWRLINESGLLKKLDAASPELSTEEPDEISLGDEVFDAALLVIPFSFLLLMMDILIHYQYAKEPNFRVLGERMLTRVPILSVFIFYTARYKQHRRMQILLFALAVLAGCRMLFIIGQKSWLINMRQCPPLATLWIYAIVQLELGPAAMSLVTVGGFVWLKGLRLSF